MSVRELTHTLHLPPAQSELYDGPHAEWLRDVLEQLPHLQSLVVSQLPFFDHQSLQALRHYSDVSRQKVWDRIPTFALRLLIAAQCRNTTSTSLSEGLIHLPNLVFLDLSNTTGVRDAAVLSTLQYMPNLQILKIRQANLRDEDIEIVAAAIGVRVRSLDLRGNLLTDVAVKTLLSFCFKGVDADDEPISSVLRRVSTSIGIDDWPSGMTRPDPDLLDNFRNDVLDEHFIKQLASPTVNRLPSEDLPFSGITHLYMSDNLLTVKGLLSLIKSERLFVLDAGRVKPVKNHEQPRTDSCSPPSSPKVPVGFQGIEKLTPALDKYSHNKMTSLRIHHAVVTQAASFKGDDPHEVFYELDSQDIRYELDGSEPIFELANNEGEQRYELAGDPTHITLSPAIGERPSLSEEERLPTPNRGGAFAPEVIEGSEPEGEDAIALTATGLAYSAQAVNGVTAGQSSRVLRVETDSSSGEDQKPELSIALIERQRHELRSSHHNQPHGLSPGMLPRLRSLTLVDVPCYETSRDVVNSLILFISDCAMEAKLARLQSNISKPPKIKKPSELSSVEEKSNARDIFALSLIVLEMGPPPSSTGINPRSPRTPQNLGFTYRTKSSTEDADSEALWSAQENDFTFFGDEEECGLPAKEPGLNSSLPVSSDKMVLPVDTIKSSSSPTSPQYTKPNSGVDVIQELVTFRKERKAAYEEALMRGEKFVNGYWPGEIKVVRWNARHGRQRGHKDYYGNFFEKGVYR